MKPIRIAAAQFQNKNGDKTYNLSRIRELTRVAVEGGADVISFHEACVSAYTFIRNCTEDEVAAIAEPVPDGPSTMELMRISSKFGIPVLAGLIENDHGTFYNTYICVHGNKFVARHRKLHAFINRCISSGSEFCVFELLGCKCGYDNNVIENVRVTTLMGADIIFMPHVTCCLPLPMPGTGLIDPQLWENREADSIRLRQEFMGSKGRGWLMRWLPARAYDNGIYVVFTNPVGMDDDQVRNGNAMVLDPFGDVIAETNSFGDDIAIALCTPEKIKVSSGKRYLRARRPDLYGRLTDPPTDPPVTRASWLDAESRAATTSAF